MQIAKLVYGRERAHGSASRDVTGDTEVLILYLQVDHSSFWSKQDKCLFQFDWYLFKIVYCCEVMTFKWMFTAVKTMIYTEDGDKPCFQNPSWFSSVLTLIFLVIQYKHYLFYGVWFRCRIRLYICTRCTHKFVKRKYSPPENRDPLIVPYWLTLIKPCLGGKFVYLQCPDLYYLIHYTLSFSFSCVGNGENRTYGAKRLEPKITNI